MLVLVRLSLSPYPHKKRPSPRFKDESGNKIAKRIISILQYSYILNDWLKFVLVVDT